MKLGQPCQRDLEGSVAGNKGGKFSQALLAAASNTHLKSVSSQIGKVHWITSIMFPPGFLMIREILMRLMIASGKNTKSMLAPRKISLYWK